MGGAAVDGLRCDGMLIWAAAFFYDGCEHCLGKREGHGIIVDFCDFKKSERSIGSTATSEETHGAINAVSRERMAIGLLFQGAPIHCCGLVAVLVLDIFGLFALCGLRYEPRFAGSNGLWSVIDESVIGDLWSAGSLMDFILSNDYCNFNGL